jgi:hypothetical protein
MASWKGQLLFVKRLNGEEMQRAFEECIAFDVSYVKVFTTLE